MGSCNSVTRAHVSLPMNGFGKPSSSWTLPHAVTGSLNYRFLQKLEPQNVYQFED